MLMTAKCPIPRTLVENTWRSTVGRGPKRLDVPEGDSVIVKPFDDQKRGIEYCLKLVNDCHGDWRFRWLELFNPKVPNSESMNHRKIRQRRRMAEKT
jgi:hypothetical protein